MRVFTRNATLLLICTLFAVPLAFAQSAPSQRAFTLANRVSVELAGDWSERRDVRLPPPASLATSAPPLRVSDFLVVENSHTPAIVELALSDNPFLGKTSGMLEEQLQARQGAVQHLFYFFFPPPEGCLQSGEAAFQQAKRKAEEEARERENEKARRAPSRPRPVTVTEVCTFGPALREFFSGQISPAVVFSNAGGKYQASARLREFYLPPMEQREIGDMTFFLFEAQSERIVEREQIQQFGLPEDLRGARTYYFWAIGARTPFPLISDPHRKDLQLVHVVYATVRADADARADFLALLARVQTSQ